MQRNKMMIVSNINCIVFSFAIGILSANAMPSGANGKWKIGIIGAGPSGLVSAKHAIDQQHEVVIWEQGEALGGIWYYTEKTGKNIYTPMYKELRTNVPYQLVEFPGWPYPNNTQSFPSQNEVWNYIDSYAKHFGIDKFINLQHRVNHVHPIEEGKWSIEVEDVKKKKTKTDVFDAVFVCSGVFSMSIFPENIKDMDKFKGKTIHSRDYRKAETFRKKNVLVIGAGPSGRDIAIHVAKRANRVTLSRHVRKDETAEDLQRLQRGYGPKITLKGEVKRLTKKAAEFEDGTQQTFDTIIYATGFAYSYPFLGEDTKIQVDDNYVSPLYKQIINIEHPTMAFIGVVTVTATMPMSDLQARFALKFITGAKKLPSRDAMMEDMNTRSETLWSNGVAKSKTHVIGYAHGDYADELATTAGIQNIPRVISDMVNDVFTTIRVTDPFGFRSLIYTIESDTEFSKRRIDVADDSKSSLRMKFLKFFSN
ncbi:dimethylaniline monooxygenase [N-oxide-forming] 3-like isoform X2 [Contarinia nasturtii]|uniref:dimethylaniline monooxygenase [N-oxide-forming] 3-like isoform X2 n=1 Tax=Contarinia nasturtii TaxID=265458 RepID=UPI0012D38310|nr:dimethylaniline monooxygenase [N-oxide-forming] 3-like isoform X2 [Contarinia nasturtii]